MTTAELFRMYCVATRERERWFVFSTGVPVQLKAWVLVSHKLELEIAQRLELRKART